MKTKKIQIASILFSVFLLFAFFSTPLYANNLESDVGFTVAARLPENQINANATYFDLLMQPNDTQILEVDIYNNSNAEISVEIEAITASTNRNGVIDYTTPDIKDDSMQIAFSEIATPLENSIIIPANSKKKAEIEVTMPEEEYDGTVLGGILIRKLPLKNETNSNSNERVSTTIENRYNYVIGVKLSETDTEISPDFEIVEAKPNLINYHKAISTSIRNTMPLIIKDMTVSSQIFKEGSDVILLENTLTNVDMAPNSVMEFPTPLNGTELKSGHYISKIQLELGEDTWNFEEPFEITSEQTTLWNIESVESNTSSIPTWAIILILLAALILLTLILFIFLTLRKKNEGKKHEK